MDKLTLEGQPWFRRTCNYFAICSSMNQTCRGADGLNTWTDGKDTRNGDERGENSVYKAFSRLWLVLRKGFSQSDLCFLILRPHDFGKAA